LDPLALVPKPRTTKWNPLVDKKPVIDAPRAKFINRFSNKYVKNARSVLDLGCGIGSYTYNLDNQNCLGLDIEINALNIAKKYSTKTDFIQGSVSKLPFRDEAFELISLWGVIEQLPIGIEVEVIKEIRRVLSYGGYFLLSAVNNHIISKILDPDFYISRQRYYSAKKLAELITENGFDIEECTIRGGLYTLLTISIFYLHKYILYKTEGRLLRFFYKKSDKEFHDIKGGRAIIFLVSKKKNQIKSELSDKHFSDTQHDNSEEIS
jgi:ubiquinone/menaquinone biosynthesis C-methylase UbiE